MVSHLYCITYLVSYFVLHTGLVSSFGGCMAQASYFDTARRPVSFLAKKARFVTTSNLRSCHKAQAYLGRWGLAQPQPTRYTSCSSSRYTVQTGEKRTSDPAALLLPRPGASSADVRER